MGRGLLESICNAVQLGPTARTSAGSKGTVAVSSGRSDVRRLRVLPRIATTVFLGLLVAACSAAAPSLQIAAGPAATDSSVSSSPDQPFRRVVVAIPSPGISFVPLAPGQARGIYMQEGLEVEITQMRTDLMIAGLTSGQIDYGTPLSTVVRAASAGAPVKLVMTILDRVSWDFVTRPEITTIDDLRGRSIGITTRNGNLHLAARAVLQHYGIPDNEVTYISFPGSPDIYRALSSNAVQAAVFTPPLSLRVRREGYRVVMDTSEVYNGAMQGLATALSKLEAESDEVERMIRATLRSIAYVREHSADTTAFIKEYTDEPPELAPELYEYLLRTMTISGEISLKWVQEELAVLDELGVTPQIRDPEKLVDLRPWRRVRGS